MGHLRATNRLFRKKWCAVQERALRLRRGAAPFDVVESTPPAESSVFALTALDRSPEKVEALMTGASGSGASADAPLDVALSAESNKPPVVNAATALRPRRQSQPWVELVSGCKHRLTVAATPSSPAFFSRAPSRGSAVAAAPQLSKALGCLITSGLETRYANGEIDASHALPSRPARKSMPKCARWPDSDYSLIDRFNQDCLSKELGLTAGDQSTLRITRPALDAGPRLQQKTALVRS